MTTEHRPIIQVSTWAQPAGFQPVTDAQWDVVRDLFPNPIKRGRGKPHCSWRTVLNSILFILSIGGKWGALSNAAHFASKSSAHRWFVLWEKNGFLDQVLDTLRDHSDFTFSFPPRRKRAASE